MYNKQLLTKNNAKTKKGEKYGYITYILYMAPHKQNSLGKNLCPNASQGCAQACLYKSGFGGIYDSVQRGRIDKAELFLTDREFFMNYLSNEISKLKAKHEKKDETIVIRLNGTSDIPYENIKLENGNTIFEEFSDIQFYDYTKSPKRMENHVSGKLSSNYHLTFSRSEENDVDSDVVLGNGGNVAMVFNKLPKTYKGFTVINGDESDLRFLDEENVIVGLKYKNNTGNGGKERNEVAYETGFVIEI
jgi:hypothetical protein